MGVAAMELEEQQAIFENAGQAVHVAFLILAQEATQDAPLRKAIIRVMESIQLAPNQRHWLDQLRGAGGGGSVNFAGLSSDEIRAQCVMITQAVKTKLPDIEMWVLQAKYGQVDFEDVVDAGQDGAALAALEQARADVLAARKKLEEARAEKAAAAGPWAIPAPRARWDSACESVNAMEGAVVAAESKQQAAQVVFDQRSACRLLDNGRLPRVDGAPARRRFAFSPERIAAIKGLSDWFAPMFPHFKPLAIDCMLGRMFANHKKIDISARDLAEQFGGSHMRYVRAAWKMKNHLRILEENALARLEPTFQQQGVTFNPEIFGKLDRLERFEEVEELRELIKRKGCQLDDIAEKK